jgi:hypothetical protein
LVKTRHMTGQYHPVLRPLSSKIFEVLASLHTVIIEGIAKLCNPVTNPLV